MDTKERKDIAFLLFLGSIVGVVLSAIGEVIYRTGIFQTAMLGFILMMGISWAAMTLIIRPAVSEPLKERLQ